MKNSILFFILLFFLNLKGQNNKTQFGIQYKPIIPSEYFNSSHISDSYMTYQFKLTPKYSNSLGMVLRQNISKLFLIEYGLNYTQRNYKLKISANNENFSDYTLFGIRSYEIPFQFLIYIRATKHWYVNVAFGLSHNILASDIISKGNNEELFYQKTFRKNGGYQALLANIGMEFEDKNLGRYYIGTSLQYAWSEIARVYPEYYNTATSQNFNDQNFEDKFYLEIPGDFVTIDFRYFFKE